MKTLILWIIIFNSGCSLFTPKKITENINKEVQRICFSSDGRGRISILDHTYSFSYESELNIEENQWMLGLEFPLYGEEIIAINWKDPEKPKILGKLEERILKEKDGIDPIQLEYFLNKWAQFIYEVVKLKEKKNNYQEHYFNWKVIDHKLVAESNDSQRAYLKGTFSIPNDEFFTRMQFSMEAKSHQKEAYKLELLVRNCAEKSGIEL